MFRTLERPRPLTADERRLLDQLAAAAARPGLAELVASSTVTGACSCGCSSVLLSTPGSADGAGELGDHVGIQATSRSPDGHLVDVVLHLVHGRPQELEVFDIRCGEGVAVPLDGLELLDGVELS